MVTHPSGVRVRGLLHSPFLHDTTKMDGKNMENTNKTTKIPDVVFDMMKERIAKVFISINAHVVGSNTGRYVEIECHELSYTLLNFMDSAEFRFITCRIKDNRLNCLFIYTWAIEAELFWHGRRR